MPVFHLLTSPNSEGEFELSSDQVQHWIKARRAKSGDKFDIWLPQGQRARAAFFLHEKRWFGKILETLKQSEAPLLPLHLGVAWIRWSRLEWLVEKITELGVKELTLLKMKNSRYAKDAQLSEKKMERLQRISQQAAEQCERFTPLKLHPPQDLEIWLRQLPTSLSNRWILISRSQTPILKSGVFAKNQAHACLIGPEGGFSETELELAEQHHFESAQLGDRILRTETAALAVAAILSS